MDNEVVLIEVFGMKGKTSKKSTCSGGCSSCSSGCTGCGGSSGCEGCTVNKDMFQQYEELVNYIKSTDVAKQAEIEFVDAAGIDIDKYDYMEEALKRRLMLPIVVINGVVRYYGGVSNKLVYREIKKELESQYLTF